MNPQKRKKNEEGFSLIEILIGIAIILILMTSVGFAIMGNVGRARRVAAKDHVRTLALALDAYMLDCGRYPTEDQGLKALVEKPILSPVPKNWNGPYIQTLTIPIDPWSNEYEYMVPGPGGLPFGIRSYGADAIEGGQDNDKDITTWETGE